MYERERRLQTDLSWPADFIPRGLDGLEGLLMSGATGQISEVDRGHAPKREPSTFTLDPIETHDYVSLSGRNAVNCGPTIEPVGRQCPATSSRLPEAAAG